MPKITLYYIPENAPCRGVMLTGAALNIEFDLKMIYTRNVDELCDELENINPKRTVPTIKDGEFNLWESRAILVYLAEKYDKREEFNLYPNVPEIRAKINQMLYFDTGSLCPSFDNFFQPVLYNNGELIPAQYEKIIEVFNYFNTMLESRDKLGEENLYVVVDWSTIADLSLAASVTNFIACGLLIKEYPFVEKWYKTIKKMPYFKEANTSQLDEYEYKTFQCSRPEFWTIQLKKLKEEHTKKLMRKLKRKLKRERKQAREQAREKAKEEAREEAKEQEKE